VSDEFITRYQAVSHEDLWRQLKAGNPEQVDKLAAVWKSLHDTAHSLATSLDQDLGRLTAGWASSSGTEYQRRLHLITSYSETMAEEFTSLQRGLSLMSGPLRTAQKHAEDPAATDNNDKAIQDAVIGTVILGPAGGVLGGFFGHSQDEQEKEKAHQRMVQVVATLAAEYSTTRSSNWSAEVPLPPPDLPGTVTDTGPGARSGPTVTTPGSVGGTHFAVATQRGIDNPSSVAHGPTNGTGEGETDDTAIVGPDGKPLDGTVPTSTTLAGTGTLLGAAGLVGAGGLAGALYGAGGATPATGAFAGPGGYPMGGAAGAGGRGLGPGSTLAADEVAGRQAGGPLGTGRGQTGAGTGRGNGMEDEPDEHMTWLTEDDMVWGAEEGASPPVLGAPRTAE
jgi:uncharacterized protein YukE